MSNKRKKTTRREDRPAFKVLLGSVQKNGSYRHSIKSFGDPIPAWTYAGRSFDNRNAELRQIQITINPEA